MNASALSAYEVKLAGLHRKSRLRALVPQQGIDFTSNDYLGLADAPRLKAAITEAIERGVPVGAGGSRLLRGNHPEHEALEVEAAAFSGRKKRSISPAVSPPTLRFFPPCHYGTILCSTMR